MQQSIGNRVLVPAPIDARANSRELLESLGWKVLEASPRRHPDGATRHRRSGGKSRGYCPVLD